MSDLNTLLQSWLHPSSCRLGEDYGQDLSGKRMVCAANRRQVLDL
jgi:hypothetical protein